jgi:hypothetical protein
MPFSKSIPNLGTIQQPLQPTISKKIAQARVTCHSSPCSFLVMGQFWPESMVEVDEDTDYNKVSFMVKVIVVAKLSVGT